MIHKLQSIILPTPAFGADLELYLRKNTDCHLNQSLSQVEFSKGGRIDFSTFFNAFSVNKWKSSCSNIKDLHFAFKGRGYFRLVVKNQRLNVDDVILEDVTISLEENETCRVRIKSWIGISEGIISVSFEALSDGSIQEAQFETESNPERAVKLGIVITHFNRKSYVLPAIQRIQDELTRDPNYKGFIDLIVVDNSMNISQQESHGAILVPNKNLGGSGGFTRGLLYLLDNENYTHCLFMDDDGSCEIESIRRTFSFMAYSTAPRTAIAGALLREAQPYELWEKGSKFKGVCKPIFSELDVRSVSNILKSEIISEETTSDYGAWWFFCFALSDIKSFPFPFFVRGDDILFSFMNKFNIVTLNGVACWGEDFSFKHGPLTSYLDARYHLLIAINILKYNRFAASLVTLKSFLLSTFSYNYASAQAVLMALQHFNSGSDFWEENLDMSSVRSQIAQLAPSEKLVPLDLSTLDYVEADKSKGSKWGLIGKALLMHGHFLPDFLLKDKCILQEKNFYASFANVFRYKKILYWHNPLKIGYVATMNRGLFFKLLSSFLKEYFIFIFQFKKMKQDYQLRLPYLTSRKFWNEVYKNDLTLQNR